uniref:t-SNARE coiled-coil homology domain-containing protein n=1 Tax=Mucochytrium quahogii TaxID=96639 RepID=A0A7S2RX72_9STRA|mmetsp:Transcript_4601/g.6858  ORF Transcript_4601/g.6858 Transcript_4601/m.6858 type:complete len:330 (-) Transcript_4601:1552-2541(-)
MALVDRTNDFFRAASAQVEAGVGPVNTLRSNGKRNPTEEAKEFTKKAGAISKKIQLTTRRLQRLAELTRTQGIHDDPGEEINTLAARLKNDTKFVKIELDQLQTYLNRNKQQVGHGSTNASAHSQTVVETMQMQLHNAARSFKTVLETRQTSMKTKSDHRSLFGQKRPALSGASPLLLSKPTPNLAQPNNAPPDGLPRPGGVTTPPPSGNNMFQGAAALGGDDSAPLIQANEVIQDDTYLTSRAEAMTTIESHIVELGDVFSQLSTMIAEQGTMVQRIDDNVRNTQDNLQHGHDQLMQTWNNMSGNKWLAAKLVGVLLLFITFFVLFLA